MVYQNRKISYQEKYKECRYQKSLQGNKAVRIIKIVNEALIKTICL